MKCRLIRPVPGSEHSVGDIIESPFCWYLVDLGYAIPLDFQWKTDPVKAAKARKKLEHAYAQSLLQAKAKKVLHRHNPDRPRSNGVSPQEPNGS